MRIEGKLRRWVRMSEYGESEYEGVQMGTGEYTKIAKKLCLDRPLIPRLFSGRRYSPHAKATVAFENSYWRFVLLAEWGISSKR